METFGLFKIYFNSLECSKSFKYICSLTPAMKSWEMRAENCSDLVKSLNYLATDISVGALLLQVWSLTLYTHFLLEKIRYVLKEEETNMILSSFNIFMVKYFFQICKWQVLYIRKIESVFKMILEGIQ